MDPDINGYSYRNVDDGYKKKLRILILLVGAIVLLFGALGAYSFYKSQQFRVVSTNPKTTNVATVTPFFKITFNKPLSSQNVSVTSSPSIIKSYSIDDETLNITLNEPMTKNTTYTINLGYISDTKDQHISGQKFLFVPKYVPASQLPNDQAQTILNNQDKYSSAYHDPIVSHLPYDTLDFSLSAIINGDDLTLQAQLLLAPGVSGSEETQDIAQYKQEVLQYITSLGLNPAKYNIQYQIVHESLNGP